MELSYKFARYIRKLEFGALHVNVRKNMRNVSLENLDFRSNEREKGTPRDSASFSLLPFTSPYHALSSRFLDFLPVWPRLNYRKPCFGCHGRIPISRRVARVAGTPYGVSRILYEFLSWNDSFICLSSIPSPPPLPPAPLPSLARPSLSPSLRHRLATGTAESLSIPICLSFHLTKPQTWRAFCRGPDGWISRASKPATELTQSGCEN